MARWELATCSLFSRWPRDGLDYGNCDQRIESMKTHSRLLTRSLVLSVAVVVFIAGHGIILYYVSSHTALRAAVLSGVIILVVIKHLGMLGPLYALFRRRSRS
jgi:membrane protein YdbS with pleckstrin-like domain